MRASFRFGLGLAAVASLLVPPAPAQAADPPRFGPIGAPLHPGMQTITGGQAFCTANFVFSDAKGRVYFGQSAHCARVLVGGEPRPGTGCTFSSMPLGTGVQFGGSGVTGTLAYSGWLTMQERGETDVDACQFNDFALVEVPAAAVDQVNPSLPLFGGPTGVNTTGTQTGDLLVGYGNSPTRQGIEDLAPKQSVAVGSQESRWSHDVYSFSPGIPGDSGGPYLDAEGRALGSLTSLVLAPAVASNSLTDIGRALAYAQEHSGIEGLTLAQGTEEFHGPLLTDALTGGAGPEGLRRQP